MLLIAAPSKTMRVWRFPRETGKKLRLDSLYTYYANSTGCYVLPQIATHLQSSWATCEQDLKLSVACVDDEGNKLTLTGLHARTGRFLTTPNQHDMGVLFIDCDLVAAAMKERCDVTARLNHIEAALLSLAIKEFTEWTLSEGKREFVHADEIANVKSRVAEVAEIVKRVSTLEELLAATEVKRDTRRHPKF